MWGWIAEYELEMWEPHVWYFILDERVYEMLEESQDSRAGIFIASTRSGNNKKIFHFPNHKAYLLEKKVSHA